MSHYLTDESLDEDDLRRIIEIVASCTDMSEVYFETDEEEDRKLLRQIFKPKFLPEDYDE